MQILILGNAGYLGSIITNTLLNASTEIKVIGLDSLEYNNWLGVLPYLGHKNFEFHKGNILDELPLYKLMDKADIIINLAALVGPVCETKQLAANLINNIAVQKIAKYTSKNQLLIVPCTNSGYGTTNSDEVCTENSPMNPISIYGKTKCEGERAILDCQSGISLRLATVFGCSPRMRFDLLVNDFTEKIYRNRTIELFQPEFKRNFVHIRDVARCMLWIILQPDLNRGLFNVGLDQANMSKLELAQKICAVVGLKKWAVTKGLGEDPDKRDYVVSSKKIRDAGFVFKYTLEDGIREVIKLCEITTVEETKSMRNA